MENELLKLAMPLQADEPRLSGKLSYGPPHRWRIVEGDSSLRIVANRQSTTRFVRGMLILAALSVPGLFAACWKSKSIPHIPWVVAVCAALPALPIVIGAGIFDWLSKRDERLGPWFEFDRARNQFEFQRLRTKLTREQIIRWELVSGAWVRGEGKIAKLHGDDISELQLVFHEGQQVFALPLIGDVFNSNAINRAAERISKATGVPLEHVVEKRSIRQYQSEQNKAKV